MNKAESKYFNTAVKMDLALISLLKKKPFEYITVSEICKNAEVNRSTFYLHYETIGDLLNETARYLLNDFLSYFSSDTQSIAHNLMGCNLNELVFICDEYLVPYLTYIKENKEVFKAELCLLLRYLFAAMRCIVAELADEFHTAPDVVSDDIAELLVIHQADEIVLIGHDEITVNRIHPFDRKLHCSATVKYARRRIYVY
mgnify:CR=1 FL=1